MTLYTNKLLLKTVTYEDLSEVARMWGFEKGPISMEEARNAIEYMQSNHTQNKTGYIYHLCFAVYEKGKDIIIGWCGLDGKTVDKLHIFFLIDAKYRNRGYATQCAETLLSYAFEEAKVPYVNGGCDKNNTASFNVMTKIGMKQNAFDENEDPLFFIDETLYREL